MDRFQLPAGRPGAGAGTLIGRHRLCSGGPFGPRAINEGQMHIPTLLLALLAWTAPAASQVPPLLTGKTLDLSVLSGEWSVEAAPAKVEPRLVGSMSITTRLNEVLIQRRNSSPDTYRVDGTPTDLGNGRVGSVLLVADGIVFSTRRLRQLPAGPSATMFSDYYRLDGDVLTLDSVRTQSRPDGTLAWMENTRVIIRYRRVR